MTYCCGILVRDGLVMIADTRTNAGLDNVSTFRKLHVYTEPGERIMALASSGNLSLGQSVRSTLIEGFENPDTSERETLLNSPTMFQGAQRIGRAIRTVQSVEGKALDAAEIDHEVAFLFGGQIKGSRLQLFMIYSAGNFIECTTDTPYLQIGEHKYGKPVLDRAIKFDTDLYDALKIGLVSMDSTMRSNLGVGLPIDIGVHPFDGAICVLDAKLRNQRGWRIAVIVRLLEPLEWSGIPSGREQRGDCIIPVVEHPRHIVGLVHQPLAIVGPTGREHILAHALAVEKHLVSAKRR